MRENIGIFRGKRVDTGQWEEGYLLGLQDKISGKDLFFIVDEMGEYHRVDPETVGEFTGMNDEDGTELFEGDIVENIESGMRALVQYFPEHAAFMLWCRSETVNQIEYVGEISLFEVQVIGNIHDNPELIEGGSNENEHRKETDTP